MPVRDLLRLYRVRDWLHFLPLPLAGWLAGDARDLRALLGATLGWSLALAYMSAVNQAFDDGLDRRAGKNPVGARIDRLVALRLAAIPGVLSLAVIVRCAPRGIVPALALLLASTAYSAPPRLKRVPLLGTLWNVVIALPGLVLADPTALDRPSLRAQAALFALLLLASQLIHEAEDVDDDRAGGVTTLAVILGARGALALASLVLASLPLASLALAAELPLRALLVLATLAFAAPWCAILGARARGGSLASLRALRLRYRYASLAMGAVVLALTAPR